MIFDFNDTMNYYDCIYLLTLLFIMIMFIIYFNFQYNAPEASYISSTATYYIYEYVLIVNYIWNISKYSQRPYPKEHYNGRYIFANKAVSTVHLNYKTDIEAF